MGRGVSFLLDARGSRHTQTADVLCSSGDFAAALRHLNEAVADEPTNPAHLINRARVHLALATSLSFAAAATDAALASKLSPSWAQPHLLLGLSCRSQRQFASSAAALELGLGLAVSALSDTVSAGQAPTEMDAAEALISEFNAAIEETTKMAFSEGDGLTDAMSSVGEGEGEGDSFTAAEAWLKDGSSFPFLYMRRYSEGNRGVHVRCDVPAETELLAVGHEYLITVEMGRACPIGRKIAAAGIERNLSAAKHCYLVAFVLCDRRNLASFYVPYYRMLPESYPSMPIFWSAEELAWLEGSFLLTQVADRKANIAADYEAICRAAPEMASFSLDEFSWGRMMVASRNFGIVVDGCRTDALVPYADMLNHLRPRQTRWAYDNRKRQFVITSLQGLHAGQQVFDSYGKKCNSRFLLNYGFAVDHNSDDDIGQNHNEVRLVLTMPQAEGDASHGRRLEVASGLVLERFDKDGELPASLSRRNLGSSAGADASARSRSASAATSGKDAWEEADGKGVGEVSRTLGALDIAEWRGGKSVALPGVTPGCDFEGAVATPGAVIGRAVRVSPFYDADSTTEAFSWLRLANASAGELAALPRMDGDEDLVRRPLRPLSAATEAGVLRQLAEAAEAQLSIYPTTYEQDVAEIGRGTWPIGSNKRNALVLLRGEKEVCRHYIALAAQAAPYLDGPLASLPFADARTVITRGWAGTGDIDRYMRSVVLPLIKRKEEGGLSGPPGTGRQAVAPPPVPPGHTFPVLAIP
jgi:hypothetical protein